MRFHLVLCLLVALLGQAECSRRTKLAQPNKHQNDGFKGCPYQNDFYYSGVISSPFYPEKYPKDDKCWYYVHARPGSVLSFNFSHFDLDVNDFITIYDGPTDIFPILVQLGGPNGTATPQKVYTSSERFALVTFTSSGESKPKTGFSFSYTSVQTAYPCNRDILLGINAMGGLKTQPNYLRQLSFISQSLIANWTVGLDQVRVFINLQNVPLPGRRHLNRPTRQRRTNLHAEGRHPVHRVESQVWRVAASTTFSDDQDYNEALEYAHIMRTTEDVKVITVAMGAGLDVKKIGALSYGEGYYFGADYANLSTLTAGINAAICSNLPPKCGA